MAPDQWKQVEPSSSMPKHNSIFPQTRENLPNLFFLLWTERRGGVRANVDRWVKQFDDLQQNEVKEEIVNEIKVTYVRTTDTF